MPDYSDIGSLAEAVLGEMKRLGYSEETAKYTRRMFADFSRFAGQRGDPPFSEQLAVDFLNGKFGTELAQLYDANPKGSYMKSYLRAMRMLLEWSECGCICKRMPGELRRTALPPGLQALLDSFNEASRENGCSQIQVHPLVEADGVAVGARLPITGDAGLYQQSLGLVVGIGSHFLR